MEITTATLYSITSMLLFTIGLHGIFSHKHFMRKAMSANIIGTGIFLFLVALANRNPEGGPDPVPHAMVLTGIVVAVSATAFMLAMAVHLYTATGSTDFESILTKKDHQE